MTKTGDLALSDFSHPQERMGKTPPIGYKQNYFDQNGLAVIWFATNAK